MTFCLRKTWPWVKWPWGLQITDQFFFFSPYGILASCKAITSALSPLVKFLLAFFFILLLVKDQSYVSYCPNLVNFFLQMLMDPWGHRRAWNTSIQDFSFVLHARAPPWPHWGSFLTCPLFARSSVFLKSKSLNTWVNHGLADLMEALTLLLKIKHRKVCPAIWTRVR